MFLLSKLAAELIKPVNLLSLLAALCVVALLLRRYRLAAALGVVTAALSVVFSCVPLGRLLVSHLESRLPMAGELPAHVDGIVVLGGSLDSRAHDDDELLDIAMRNGRIRAMMSLAAKYRDARVVFTGGNGHVDRSLPPEAWVVRNLLDELGIDERRVTFESLSRNTFENAQLTKAVANPRPSERWLLVTNAVHMPRAVAVFRKAGWNVLPYPVDHVVTGPLLARPWLTRRATMLFYVAIKEYVGLAAYRMSGRTDELFPRL